MSADPQKLLAIYLNDHLAGSMVGIEVARRLEASNSDEPAFGPPLAEIRAEFETDREALETTMEKLDIARSKIKPAAGWAGEKLGRLKLNGQLTGYSPLSRLVELELLIIGISGKLRMWKALERTRDEVDVDFARFARRAADQRAKVEELHLLAADIAYEAAPEPVA